MSSRVRVKLIKPKDAFKLKKLFKKALFSDFSYFPGEYLERVDRSNSLPRLLRASLQKKKVLLGLFEENKLHGYVIADASDPGASYVFWVYVNPEMRNSGWGKELLNETILRLKNLGSQKVGLITHQFEGFYKSLGFDTINKNTNLFDDITMYEMVKKIDD